MKKINIKFLTLSLLSCLMIASIAGFSAGCGNANSGNSDAITAFGFYPQSDSNEDLEDIEAKVGIASFTVVVDSITGEIPNGDPIAVQLGVMNNLKYEYVKLVKQYYQYTTSNGLVFNWTTNDSSFMGPANSDTNDTSGSLPDSFRGIGNTTYTPVHFINPEFTSWLYANAALLPDLPFNVSVEVTLEGESFAGDTVTSKANGFLMQFYMAPEPTPTPDTTDPFDEDTDTE